MARDLKLQVILDAVDKATGPLKKITQGSGKTAEALKASKQALRDLERQQRDLSSFRKLKEVTRENGEALAAAQERLRNMRAELKQTDAPTEKFQRQFKQASDEVDRLTGKMGEQRRRLGELRSSLKQGGISTDNLGRSENRLAEQIRDANQQFDAQKRKMGEVAQQQRRMSEAQKRYHRTIGRANNMTGAGFTAAATGGAALYGAGRLLAPGIDYGETMSKVQALTRLQADDPRLAALKQQSRDLGASTAFSASQVGQGQAFLAMAGFTPEAIRQAIPDMLNMALANGLDLGRTADIGSNILSGFGLDPSQMGRVADVLTATTTRANVDLEMLGESMKYVAPQAKAMGLSLEQAAAMAGLLGNVGIQGSQAGTTLRAMMTRLAAPTGAAAGALKELGVNAKDADGNLRDVPKILADVARATQDMGSADQASYLKAIFGEEPGAGMAELIAQQGAAGVEKFVGILQNAAGESGRVAKTMADNIGGDLKGLKSAWDEVGISITDTNKGPLRELIQNVTAITRGIGNWIKANPELAGDLAKVAAVLATVVAVGGTLTVMLASILGPIAAMRYGMTILGIGLGGTEGRMAKLAKAVLPSFGKASEGAAGKASLLSQAWHGMRGAWKKANPRTLTPAVKKLGESLLLLPANIDDAVKATWRWSKVTGKNATQALGGTIKNVGILARNRLVALKQGFIGATRAAYRYVAVNGVLGTGINMTSGAFKGLRGIIGGGLQAALTATGGALRVVGQSLLFVGRAALLNPIGLVITAISGAALLVYKYWQPIKAFFTGFWQGLRDGLAPVAETLGPAFTALGSALKPLKPIWDGIAGVLGTVWGWISKLLQPVQSTAEDLNAATSAGEKFGHWLANVINIIPNAIADFTNFGANLIDGVIGGIKAKWQALKDSVTDIASSVAGWFKDKLGINSPSRVFKAYGGYTVDGLNVGLDAQRDEPAKRVAEIARRVQRAGAGLALGAAALPAAAMPGITPQEPIRFDTRPPLSQPASRESGGLTMGDVNIEVNAAPGMDERQLAQYVAQEVQRALAQAQHDASARRRSSLRDID